MRTVIWGLVVVLVSGCSFFVVKPLAPDYAPPAPMKCTHSNVIPGLDLGLGGVAAVAGGLFLAQPTFTPTVADPSVRTGAGISLIAAGAVAVVSGILGLTRTTRCNAAVKAHRGALLRESWQAESAEKARLKAVQAELMKMPQTDIVIRVQNEAAELLLSLYLYQPDTEVRQPLSTRRRVVASELVEFQGQVRPGELVTFGGEVVILGGSRELRPAIITIRDPPAATINLVLDFDTALAEYRLRDVTPASVP